jgi:putative flippase GtrA
MAKKSKSETSRIIEYMVTGGAWFWSGYLLFALLYTVLGVDIVPAKMVSYLFGLTVNFLLERFWVFSGKEARKLDTVSVRYVIISVVNLGIDTLIVWGLSQYGISPYIGQFVSAGFFSVWNYLWYRLWVFAKKTPPTRRRASSPTLHRSKHVRRQRYA